MGFRHKQLLFQRREFELHGLAIAKAQGIEEGEEGEEEEEEDDQTPSKCKFFGFGFD